MAGQMLAVLGLSFALLLAVLAALEVLDQDDVVEWARSEATLARLRRMKPAVELMSPDRVDDFLAVTSSCHEGYALTYAPFPGLEPSAETDAVAERIAQALALDPDGVRVGRVQLGRGDFSYRDCGAAAVELPTTGVVISLALRSGPWLHAEVHPHEWHVRRDMIAWVTRSIGAFLFVGAIAVLSVRRLIRPLDELTGAATRFGQGLEVSEVGEAGPPDLRRAIRSFNLMQRQVADEVARRTHTLMAISHDLRTPLTALRIKAELVDDPGARRDLVASIDAMERITASALQFLRGDCHTEPVRAIDLGALVESECSDFEEQGWSVTFAGEGSFHHTCRPDALARALRCLIDNAVRHGGGAEVTLRPGPDHVVIAVADHGPGIPPEKVARALEPFERLSPARASEQGGFGLGLAIVRAVVEGHGGALLLEANQPSGLVATIRLPVGGP